MNLNKHRHRYLQFMWLPRRPIDWSSYPTDGFKIIHGVSRNQNQIYCMRKGVCPDVIGDGQWHFCVQAMTQHQYAVTQNH